MRADMHPPLHYTQQDLEPYCEQLVHIEAFNRKYVNLIRRSLATDNSQATTRNMEHEDIVHATPLTDDVVDPAVCRRAYQNGINWVQLTADTEHGL